MNLRTFDPCRLDLARLPTLLRKKTYLAEARPQIFVICTFHCKDYFINLKKKFIEEHLSKNLKNSTSVSTDHKHMTCSNLTQPNLW